MVAALWSISVTMSGRSADCISALSVLPHVRLMRVEWCLTVRTQVQMPLRASA